MANGENNREVDRLVEDLEESSQIPAKRRGVGIKSTVDRLATAAYENGLLPDELTRVIDLITRPSHLDQATLVTLIRSLYPAAGVSEEVVFKVIGCLGHGKLKPSLTIQSHLLRWLILVYHIIERQSVASQAYSVLFNLLDTAALRAQLCHLLALVTRRRHVQPFRIQMLLALSRQTGNDPCVIGLLRVYKNYYPEIIVGMATRGRASAFKHPDPPWRERLDAIQTAHSRREQAGQAGQRNGFRVRYAPGLRRSDRNSAVPAVHTLHAQETSVTLEEVDNAEQFVANLENFELPSQLIAVLADPLLQKLLLLRPRDETRARVESWISACTADIASGEAGDALLLDVLEIVRDYVLSTKDLSQTMLRLVEEMLKVWNGKDKQSAIFEIYSFLPLQDFAELHTQILGRLERKILDNSTPSQLSLLAFYTLLLRRWTIGFISADSLPAGAAWSLQQLIHHVNRLCLTLLQTAPSTSTHFSMLDFYEQVAALMSISPVVRHLRLVNPPPTVVYTLLFSPSLAVVSRLCGVLTSYKLAWEGIMGHAGRQLTLGEREDVNTFNGFLMDVCNCLWRGRAFTLLDPNAQGCQLPASVVEPLARYVAGIDSDLALTSAFTLSYSPSLCLQSISFVRGLEDAELDRMDGDLQKRHAGPVTQSSLVALGADGGLVLSWPEYRSGVLRHLQEQQIVGIPDLMHNTMKHLMSSKS